MMYIKRKVAKTPREKEEAEKPECFDYAKQYGALLSVIKGEFCVFMYVCCMCMCVCSKLVLLVRNTPLTPNSAYLSLFLIICLVFWLLVRPLSLISAASRHSTQFAHLLFVT